VPFKGMIPFNSQKSSSSYPWVYASIWQSIGGQEGSSTMHNITRLCPSIDTLGFLRDYQGKILVWLPAPLRGDTAIAPDGTIVIYGGSGAMTFVKL
jgi:hypothetical protein